MAAPAGFKEAHTATSSLCFHSFLITESLQKTNLVWELDFYENNAAFIQLFFFNILGLVISKLPYETTQEGNNVMVDDDLLCAQRNPSLGNYKPCL